MAQKHMDRLSAVDATFLHQESASTHMHIGGLVILAGSAPTYEEFLAHIDSRLHLVPRYRQKLATPPFQTGRPLWVDDPSFSLEYHIRHTALPRPGNEAQLENLTARIFSQQLDRNKPLWEMWLIEGLEGDRFAIISKSHHASVMSVELVWTPCRTCPSRRSGSNATSSDRMCATGVVNGSPPCHMTSKG